MARNWWNPEKTPTFKEVIDEYTAAEVYKDTGVDQVTQDLLTHYFTYSRICVIEPEKFIWFYRRALKTWYPIYKDQLEAWAKYKALGWYRDNDRVIIEKYMGENTEERGIKEDFLSAVKRIMTGETDTNVVGKVTTDTESGTKAETVTAQTDASNDVTNSKDRAFSFAYPESNYQGGIIPYDIENNPDVEFISNQADSISKTTVDHTGELDGTVDYNDTATGKSTTNQTTDTGQTNSSEGTDDTNSQREIDSQLAGKNSYVKETTISGLYAIQIASDLFPLIQTTDFFNQLIQRLRTCFNLTYCEDDECYDL